MTYRVKEIFYTLQGEGANAGRPAVFCRFAGCNLWSGREQDRASAACNFCDTDFNGGDSYDLNSLVDHISHAGREGCGFVVLTGGEPMLQVSDGALLYALHFAGFEVAIETNGTIAVGDGFDWITVSPKGDTQLQQVTGHELKLVFPQPLAMPARFERLDFWRFYLQPMDGPEVKENTEAAIDYCLMRPKWRLSLQTHKYIGIR